MATAVAKINMPMLNIGSGMFRFSSYVFSSGHAPKCERGEVGEPWMAEVPLQLFSMHELTLSMREPKLSLNMLILSTHAEAALDATMCLVVSYVQTWSP